MIKTEPWRGGTDEEYETQSFGFGAQRLRIAVRQMVEEKITNCVKAMESNLHDALNLNDTDKITVTRSCDKLIRLYCERAGPSLSVIDEEIERMLQVPANVLLPADEVQTEQISDEEYEKLKMEVTDMRKRVERGALMEALLTAEEDDLLTVENVCEVAKMDMEVLDLLQKSIESDSVKVICNETEYLCASAPFMKESKEINLFDD